MGARLCDVFVVVIVVIVPSTADEDDHTKMNAWVLSIGLGLHMAAFSRQFSAINLYLKDDSSGCLENLKCIIANSANITPVSLNKSGA